MQKKLNWFFDLFSFNFKNRSCFWLLFSLFYWIRIFSGVFGGKRYISNELPNIPLFEIRRINREGRAKTVFWFLIAQNAKVTFLKNDSNEMKWKKIFPDSHLHLLIMWGLRTTEDWRSCLCLPIGKMQKSDKSLPKCKQIYSEIERR